MVELDSYSSVDWPDSAVSCDKTEALKSKSPKAKLVRDRHLNIKKGVCLWIGRWDDPKYQII